MDGILREIQETVGKYAAIMAKISGVDVEVVDDSLYRIAGTGMFAQHINEDMSEEGYAYRKVLETGQLQVIYEPGNDPICQNCPKLGSCAEEIEIAMPIQVGGKTLGIIGLVGSSAHQRETILADEETYLSLIEQIASFIAAKATELLEGKKQTAMLSALECTINHLEQGLLILSHARTVTMANETAEKQLRLSIPLTGAQITLVPTGDKLNNQNEYLLTVAGKTIYILGNIYIPRQGGMDYAEVLTFTRTRDVRRKMYAMTAAVSSSTLVGSSPETAALRGEIAKVARGNSTVLITGESGTGKEIAATAIWRASPRCRKMFVALNCAAIPESLLESELFGYVKGAFTGADPSGRVGKFEQANNGVIFLDEIGDMPLYLQAKLLRVLQDRKITRIGSNQLIPIDVRVIAATNKDLKAMIANGKFREDLYYRLNVIPMHIAPLRDRREDIVDLAELFAQRYATRFEKPQCHILPDAMDALLEHPWYGNVRELENTVEFMVNMSNEDGMLGLDALPRDFFANAGIVNYATGPISPVPQPPEHVQPLREVERLEIEKALRTFGTSTQGKRQAAQALGIGLATLYRKTEEFSK